MFSGFNGLRRKTVTKLLETNGVIGYERIWATGQVVFAHPWPIALRDAAVDGPTILISYWHNPGELRRGRSLARAVSQQELQTAPHVAGVERCPVAGADGWMVTLSTERLDDLPPQPAQNLPNRTDYPIEKFSEPLTKSYGKPGRKPKYPFDVLEVGEQFTIPPSADQLTWSSLRVLCSQKTRAMVGQFKCIKGEGGAFIVRRVA